MSTALYAAPASCYHCISSACYTTPLPTLLAFQRVIKFRQWHKPVVGWGQGNTSCWSYKLRKRRERKTTTKNYPSYLQTWGSKKNWIQEKCGIKLKKNISNSAWPTVYICDLNKTGYPEELTGYSFLFKPFGLLGTNRCVHTKVKNKRQTFLAFKQAPLLKG